MHKLLAILLLTLVTMAAFVVSQDQYDDDLMEDLFEQYKRKSRTKACLGYGKPCRVDAIYRNNCCPGFRCLGPASLRCNNKSCVCQKYDKLAFLFS
ncbi:hypothetical protein HOLleu_32493 [Holothuria leucospilota]|uniref:Uncharacterized protein n=1 Tax=Holothuria leucospilota TaxID=206669 RepID=A0A9Q1BIS2_HOLLE|nr:hypothetical protein HOLleu_32493 [Holothuria leucospilota]